MLLLSRNENRVRLRAEDYDDLWHLEKVIKQGDLVTGRTTRKVVFESGESERKSVTITISVGKVEYRPDTNSLKILGKIVSGKPEEFVQTGEHHSFEVFPGTEITIEKEWKKHELDRLKEAQEKKKKVHVVTVDDKDAYVHTIRPFGPVERAHFTFRTGKYYQEKQVEKYSELFKFLQELDGLIILAGPGFWSEEVYRKLKQTDPEVAKKAQVLQTNDIGRRGVSEVLKSEEFQKIVHEARAAKEARAIEEFTVALAKNNAVYGLKKIEEALDYGAVQKLVLTDKILMERREEIERLLDRAEQTRTEVIIVSHENPESEKITAFGGIVGTLRFRYE